MKYSKVDAIFGAIVVNIVAFFIVLACAATIYTNGIQVNNVADVSNALVPLAGQYASILFAFGFLNASLFAASILPLSTAYYVCESLGFEAGVSKGFREAPVFHGLYLGLIILGGYHNNDTKRSASSNSIPLPSCKWSTTAICIDTHAVDHK